MTYQGATSGDDFVTGDAVAVELRYAKLASRSLAFGIDLLLQVAALVLMTLLVGALTGFADEGMVYVVLFVSTLAIIVGYPVTCETLTRGRTVGKMAIGLRVVRGDGGSIRFRHALVRGLLAVVEVYMFLAVSVISSLLSPEGKRLGDYLAGTVVIRERAPRPSTFTPWIHPMLQGWAASLDVSRLQPATALSARQYLSRVATLTPEARARLGASLAQEVAAQVTPAPPMQLPPETYLAAVLAERARRAEASSAVVEATATPADRDTAAERHTAPALDTASESSTAPSVGEDFTAPD